MIKRDEKGRFIKGVYYGKGFKKGNKLGFTKGHKRCSGVNNPRFKGKIMSKVGYWLIFKPDHPFAKKSGHIQEHRLIMEEKIGRYLTKKETIHHINGIKSDNRLENLMLFPDSGSHSIYHALCRDESKLAYPRKKGTKLRLENMARGMGYTRT